MNRPGRLTRFSLIVFIIVGSALLVLEPQKAQAIKEFEYGFSYLVGVPHFKNSDVALCDLNNDDYLELILIGQSSGSAAVGVYSYNGNYFTPISTAMPPVYLGSVDCADYDNDDDLDILVTGYSGSVNRVGLYRNDGGLAFSLVTTDLPAVRYSAADWGDYDQDGDLDILIVGYTGEESISHIYRNDGDDGFVDIEAGLVGVMFGDAAWGDYDNDGYGDVLVSGRTAPDPDLYTTRLYHNNTDGSFSEIEAGLIEVKESSLDWGDYDQDGDLDVLITGLNETYNSIVYRNDGNGIFSDIARLKGVAWGDAAWGDYDEDGDLDVLLIGNPGSGARIMKIYSHEGNSVFRDIGPSQGQVGVSSGSAAWGDINLDGRLDYVYTGWSGSGEVVIARKNEMLVQPFKAVNAGLTASKYSSSAWCDLDADGDLDVLLAGQFATRLYRNEGDGGFYTPMAHTLIEAYYGSLSCIDSDQDNDLDVLITGYDGSASRVGLYRNDGNFIFTPVVTNLPAVRASAVDWGDFDLDADLDVLITGYTGSMVISQVYRNDGGNVFTDIAAGLPGVMRGAARWGDEDDDGDLDILLVGSVDRTYTQPPIAAVFHNDGNGVFTDANAGIPGYTDAAAAWGDYDEDGDLDLAIGGNWSVAPGAYAHMYRNDGLAGYTQVAQLHGAAWGTMSWGDYDYDGDLDLLQTGNYPGEFYRFARVCLNNGGNFYTIVYIDRYLAGVSSGSAHWQDADQDGDLDILLTGWTGVSNVARIYENLLIDSK